MDSVKCGEEGCEARQAIEITPQCLQFKHKNVCCISPRGTSTTLIYNHYLLINTYMIIVINTTAACNEARACVCFQSAFFSPPQFFRWTPGFTAREKRMACVLSIMCSLSVSFFSVRCLSGEMKEKKTRKKEEGLHACKRVC